MWPAATRCAQRVRAPDIFSIHWFDWASDHLHIKQKSVFRGCDVDALQRNLSLLDACAVGTQRAKGFLFTPTSRDGLRPGRTRLPHIAHQLKRGFEPPLRLALQWP